MIILQVIFWICVGALFHSYVGYPVFLFLMVKLKEPKQFKTFTEKDNLPKISVLMAAYNEEAVIEQKIRSIFKTTYPEHLIELLIGSDNSTDNTNNIIEKLSEKFAQIKFTNFENRQGKVNIINQLSGQATGDIYFITDANVLLEENTLFEVVKYFADKQIGLVDTHMKNYGLKKDGISFQEKSYISREVYVKNLESKAFGTMIGPFGGCYALRKEYFIKVPSTYLVDDFFICMNVLSVGKKAINNLDAVVYEDVSNVLSVEFKRKIRIAIGNFQNLNHFKKILSKPFTALAFCFGSHKVLRWFGPFFLIGALASNFFLFNQNQFYSYLFGFQVLITILPFADIFLKNFKIHIVLLRFATHFYTMNLSLLVGFIKSIKGVKSNVWKPTKRFQG